MATSTRERVTQVWRVMRLIVWTQWLALVLVIAASLLVLFDQDRFPTSMVFVLGALALALQGRRD